MSKQGLDLSVSLAGVTLENPITTASGTFFGERERRIL